MHEKKVEKRTGVRFGSWNVGSMSGTEGVRRTEKAKGRCMFFSGSKIKR